ncbi:hypothetical protein [Streptomyces sp. NPDC050848]
MITRSPYFNVSAKVAGGHRSILRKDFRAATDAVRETAAAHDLKVG